MADTQLLVHVEEARAAHKTMSDQVTILAETNEKLTKLAETVRESWNSTSGDAFHETYAQISAILNKMVSVVNNGAGELNKSINDYEAAENANAAELNNAINGF